MDYGSIREVSNHNATLLRTTPRVYLGGKRSRSPSRSPSPEPTRRHIEQIDSIFDKPKDRILKPTGVAGDYFDGDEPFGPEYWQEQFNEVLFQHLDPLQQFLNVYAVEVGERLEDLYDHELQSEMTKDLSVFAAHIQANYLQPPRTQAIDGLDAVEEDHTLAELLNDYRKDATKPTEGLLRTGGAQAQADPELVRAHEKEVTERQKSLKAMEKLITSSKKFNIKRVPIKTKAQALHWLLTKVENPNAVELEIINQMHPKVEEQALDYITNRYIGRMAFLKGTVSGAINAGIDELEQDSGKKISFDDALITHKLKFAKFIGAKTIMKATGIPGRYSSEKTKDDASEAFLTNKRIMLEALKGKHVDYVEAARNNVRDALNS